MISFTCNICGTSNAAEEVPWEPSTCSGCRSNVRMRALIYLLSVSLFGEARALPDFPANRNVKGFGLSDDPCYAIPLAQKFDYINTYYDRDPFLDLTAEHPGLYGTYDFILSSDVFEHVAPPVERAFDEAFRLLKPNGFLCITVPSSAGDEDTIEHYPHLHEYSIVQLGGEHVLVNRKKDKSIEIHQNLEFHGGIGATLVMREFSQGDLARKLRGVGFSAVDFQSESVERFGILLVGNWSRPLVARKDSYVFKPEPVPEPAPEKAPEVPPAASPEPDAQMTHLHKEKANLERRVAALESQLRMVSDSRWLKLGKRFGFGPKFR
jgi:SAM-dependent methyltransferase